MKLPISLLVLVALGQAASPQSAANSSDTKTSVSMQKDNQTGKRELYEGNFEERNKEVSPKDAKVDHPPNIEYATELMDMIVDQARAQKIFGIRLPQIAKISDVLSGQSPSFEAAVAKHLYSPISAYQARVSLPTSFEVPTPEASQSAYSNKNAYQLSKGTENDQKLQEYASKEVDLPNIPLFTVKQPKLIFESYPQPLDPGSSGQNTQLPQEIFQPQQLLTRPTPQLFPLIDQLGPIRYQGHVLPSQFLQQNRIHQFLPVNPGIDHSNQNNIQGKDYPNQENHEELKAETSDGPKVLNEMLELKQNYHAHPNGAISFASFSQNLPIKQYQPQPINYNQELRKDLSPQHQVLPVQHQFQEQKLAPMQRKLQFSPTLHKIFENLQKQQPDYQPQYISFKQQIQNEPRALNVLQQHLLYQEPLQKPHPQVFQLQQLPAFKPLPQSLLAPESAFQQTSPSPKIANKPRPFSYNEQSTQSPSHIHQPLAPALPPHQYTSLPPLKPNYNRYVKPLKQSSQTTPIFLPTPLQLLPTSTPKAKPDSDQLISSTTIQPAIIKDQEKSKEDSNQSFDQPETQPPGTAQPLNPEIFHQSQPTVLPLTTESTTSLPFASHQAYQHLTPQPEYQSIIRPQSIQTSPRHEVIIQPQELKEYTFEPSIQLSSTPNSHQHYTQNWQQEEREYQQLRSQDHQKLFEQLQPLQFHQELQVLQSPEYRIERQLSPYKKQYVTQQTEPQQYLVQQYSHPNQQQHFQVKQLQNVQIQQEKSQQPQRETEQTKPQQYQLEPKNKIQVSTLKLNEEPEKQIETVEITNQPESGQQVEQQSKLQPTTGNPIAQVEKKTESAPNLEQSYLSPGLSSPGLSSPGLPSPRFPFQSGLPQIYNQPQTLVAQPEFSSIWGHSNMKFYENYEVLF